MMLKYLQEAVLAGLVVPEGADKATEREILRRRRQVEAQWSLACRAILMLKSLHADVSALRVDDGDGFQGTGNCEYGHEGVEVTLDVELRDVLSEDGLVIRREERFMVPTIERGRFQGKWAEIGRLPELKDAFKSVS